MSISGQSGDLVKIEERSPYLLWLVWVVWLPLIIPTVIGFVQSHPSVLTLVAMSTGIVTFYAIYLWGSWRYVHQVVVTPSSQVRVRPETWLTLTALTLLSFALTLLGHKTGWQSLFIYTSGYISGRISLIRALQIVAVLFLLLLIACWLVGLSWLDFISSAVIAFAVIFITKSVLRAIITSWELRAAREEIARLAVTTERLRIARDLHDLLGHNLSLITLKSELAGRLLDVDPARVAAEIKDIEQVARTTLQQVREAVGNFRQPTLANELQGAQEILTAAGIDYHYTGDKQLAEALPTAMETVLSWTVREGVTNVIRYSRAHTCTIQMHRDADNIYVEISDDGIGIPLVPVAQPQHAESATANATIGGHGLRGLTERVTFLGGYLDAKPRAEGGFRLTVSVPFPLPL